MTIQLSENDHLCIAHDKYIANIKAVILSGLHATPEQWRNSPWQELEEYEETLKYGANYMDAEDFPSVEEYLTFREQHGLVSPYSELPGYEHDVDADIPF